MNECAVNELKDELENKNSILIDVRENVEFLGGRIAGAKLIPFGEIEKRHTELGKAEQIFVICRSGRRSAEAQKKLKTLGYNNVINVFGGFDAWKKAGFAFEKDENAPWALERQVRFVAGILVLVGVILSVLVHPYFIGLSGFVGAGLTFAGATDWCGMGLLLAKMPWNQRQSAIGGRQ